MKDLESLELGKAIIRPLDYLEDHSLGHFDMQPELENKLKQHHG